MVCSGQPGGTSAAAPPAPSPNDPGERLVDLTDVMRRRAVGECFPTAHGTLVSGGADQYP